MWNIGTCAGSVREPVSTPVVPKFPSLTFNMISPKASRARTCACVDWFMHSGAHACGQSRQGCISAAWQMPCICKPVFARAAPELHQVHAVFAWHVTWSHVRTKNRHCPYMFCPVAWHSIHSISLQLLALLVHQTSCIDARIFMHKNGSCRCTSGALLVAYPMCGMCP